MIFLSAWVVSLYDGKNQTKGKSFSRSETKKCAQKFDKVQFAKHCVYVSFAGILTIYTG